jgi:hypothetical protein
MFSLFKRKSSSSGITKEQIAICIDEISEQIKKLGGSFEVVRVALHAAEQDQIYKAGGYIAAERFPLSKIVVLTASLQLLNLWLEMTTRSDVEDDTRDLFFQRAYSGFIVSSLVLTIDELAELLRADRSLKLSANTPQEKFFEDVFGSGRMHALIKGLKSKANAAFFEWTKSENRSLLLEQFPPS